MKQHNDKHPNSVKALFQFRCFQWTSSCLWHFPLQSFEGSEEGTKELHKSGLFGIKTKICWWSIMRNYRIEFVYQSPLATFDIIRALLHSCFPFCRKTSKYNCLIHYTIPVLKIHCLPFQIHYLPRNVLLSDGGLYLLQQALITFWEMFCLLGTGGFLISQQATVEVYY